MLYQQGKAGADQSRQPTKGGGQKEDDRMAMKSHTPEEVLKMVSLDPKLKIYDLETGTSGNDDVLVGVDYEDVMADILNYHEIDELPDGWEITEMTVQDVIDRYIDTLEIGVKDAQWLSTLEICPEEGDWDASLAPAQMSENWWEVPANWFDAQFSGYLKKPMDPPNETYWVRAN